MDSEIKEESTQPVESYSLEMSVTFLEEAMAIQQIEAATEPEYVPPARRNTPERNLLASILGMAFLDLSENRNAEARQQAYYYLMGKGVYGMEHYREYPFLVEHVCRELDLCVIELRKIAKQMFDNPAEFRIKW